MSSITELPVTLKNIIKIVTDPSLDWKLILSSVLILQALPKAHILLRQIRYVQKRGEATPTILAKNMDPSSIDSIRQYSLYNAKNELVSTIGLLAMRVGFVYFASSIWDMSQFIVSLTPIPEHWHRAINSMVIFIPCVFAKLLAIVLVQANGNNYLIGVGLRSNNFKGNSTRGMLLLLLCVSAITIVFATVFIICMGGYDPDMKIFNYLVTFHSVYVWYKLESLLGDVSDSCPFNDTPLEDGELKDSLNALAQRMGVKYNSIIVRGDHYLPHVEGIFSNKCLILNENLVESCTEEEALALVAYGTTRRTKKKSARVISNILTGILGLVMFLVMVGNPSLYASLGFSRRESLVGFTMWSLVFSPIIPLVHFAVTSCIPTRLEDQVRSCMKLGYGGPLMSALCKQFQGEWETLFNQPWRPRSLVHADPIYARYYIDEPGLADRLAIVEKIVAEKG